MSSSLSARRPFRSSLSSRRGHVPYQCRLLGVPSAARSKECQLLSASVTDRSNGAAGAMNRSRVAKRYDRATTHCERAIARDEITRADLPNMHATMDAVRPGDLYRQIRTHTQKLERMEIGRAA